MAWSVKFDRSLADRSRQGIRTGLDEASRLILAESQAVVPRDSGELERSGAREVESTVARVGYTDSKAVGAHENMTDRYNNGRRAKFLEQAFTSNTGRVGQILANEVRRELS